LFSISFFYCFNAWAAIHAFFHSTYDFSSSTLLAFWIICIKAHKVNGRKEEQTEYAVLKNCVNRGWQEEEKKI